MANHPGRAPHAPMVGAKADLKPLGRVIRMLFQDYPAMLIAVMVCIMISAASAFCPRSILKPSPATLKTACVSAGMV